MKIVLLFIVLFLSSLPVSAESLCRPLVAVVSTPYGLLAAGQRGYAELDVMPVAACNHGNAKANTGPAKSSLSLPRIDVTAAATQGEKLWLAAHGGVVISSNDGGASWRASQLAGSDDLPILDIYFESEKRGFAVGALGLLMVTDDGGGSWQRRVVYIDPEWDEPDDLALNSIVRLNNGSLLIAAEAGAVYRSVDEGENWEKLSTGYSGSYFRALPYGRAGVVLAGLGGVVHISRDGGDNWQALEVTGAAAQSSVFAVLPLSDGELLLAGAGGALFRTENGARKARQMPQSFEGTVAGLAEYRGKIYAATDKGLQAISIDLIQ